MCFKDWFENLFMISSSISMSKEKFRVFKNTIQGFPGGAVVENPPANAWDTGSSPGLGSSHMLRSN